MGDCMSSCTGGNDAETNNNKQIEDEIKSEKQKVELKLLLLGAGESGKSTIFKQMQIIHNHGFTPEQRVSYTPIIRKHCVETFQDLVRGAQSLGLLTPELEEKASAVLVAIEQEGLGGQHVTTVTDLWKTENFQAAFAQRNQYQISDSAKYFLDHLEFVSAADYVPTYDDILQCRVRTTGVSEIHFNAGGAKFRFAFVKSSEITKPDRSDFSCTGWWMLVGKETREESGSIASKTSRESCLLPQLMSTTKCFSRMRRQTD